MFDKYEILKYDTHEHLNSKNNNIINKRIYGSGHEHMGSGHNHMGSGHNHMGSGHNHMGSGHNHMGSGHNHMGSGHEHMGSGHEHFGNCNKASYGNKMGCGGNHDQNAHLMNSCNKASYGNKMNSCQQGFEDPEGYDAHPEKYREPL